MTLGPIRHACHSCGTCCTGWRVQLRTKSERDRVLEQAVELGIDNPIIAGALRRVDGRCVFLREDRLCAVHARFGETAKPSICQHFPRRALNAADGLRIGADPGCSSTWRTYADGPELKPWPVAAHRIFRLAPDLLASERALISLCQAPDMTVPLYLAVMTADFSQLEGGSGGPPPGFAARVLGQLSHAAPYLIDRENGPYVCEALAAVASFLARFDKDTLLPPWQPLSPEANGYALDLLARSLFLRVGDDTIPPAAHMLLVMGGVLACAYVDPTPSVFGPALAAWSRVCRLDRFWVPVLPDLAMAQWVLTGVSAAPAP